MIFEIWYYKANKNLYGFTRASRKKDMRFASRVA